MSVSGNEVGSDETPPDEALQDALMAFTECIGAAFESPHQKPVCSFGLTMGDSYVPFDPDPEDECETEDPDDQDAAYCSQAWVRVESISPSPSSPEGFEGVCDVVLSINLEVGVLRCVSVPEDGEAPTATEVMLAALQAMDDMKAILTAAIECDVWAAIDIGTWTPQGPLGGQYGGTWSFTAEL